MRPIILYYWSHMIWRSIWRSFSTNQSPPLRTSASWRIFHWLKQRNCWISWITIDIGHDSTYKHDSLLCGIIVHDCGLHWTDGWCVLTAQWMLNGCHFAGKCFSFWLSVFAQANMCCFVDCISGCKLHNRLILIYTYKEGFYLTYSQVWCLWVEY